MTADVVDSAAIRANRRLTREVVMDLCDALDLARDRNAELMNDRTEALNGEALQRGRAHAAEARIAAALDLCGTAERFGSTLPHENWVTTTSVRIALTAVTA